MKWPKIFNRSKSTKDELPDSSDGNCTDNGLPIPSNIDAKKSKRGSVKESPKPEFSHSKKISNKKTVHEIRRDAPLAKARERKNKGEGRS
jgi:hypothetical protein